MHERGIDDPIERVERTVVVAHDMRRELDAGRPQLARRLPLSYLLVLEH